MTLALFPLAPAAGLGPVRPAVIPVTLEHGAVRLTMDAVLDPNAAKNFSPRSLGRRLGAVWGHPTLVARPGGGKDVRAIPLAALGTVGPFAPVPLVFAWASTDAIPVVLGRTNFFELFDVCFNLARGHVAVQPAARPGP